MTSEIQAALAELAIKEFDKIVDEIVSVQPMPDDIWAKLMSVAMSEKDLKDQGYRPVEKQGLSLLWIKDE